MKLSVLISSYNGRDDLADLLASLQESIWQCGREVEVIIRDDNSTDDSAHLIAACPWVRLLRGHETLGFVGSNNIALHHSQGEIICCLNQDTILAPGFLREGLDVLDNYPDAVGVNTNMLMPWVMSREKFQQSSLEELPAWEYQFTPFGFARYVKVESVLRTTNYMTGGAFFLRRSALTDGEELFDPAIHMYCEDTDLVLRLQERGGKIYYAPKAIVYHNQVAKKISTPASLKKLVAINWTRLRVLSRHQQRAQFVRSFPFYLFGTIQKMKYLGLAPGKKWLAYCFASCCAVLFCLSLPYWLLIRKSN